MMQPIKKRFFSWVLLFLVFIGEPIFAQNYPITSQPLLTPRFSLKWTDFYTAPNFFRLQLTLKDKDKTNVQVFLKLKLERVGLVIKTREDYIPSSPINLSFGSPTMLNGTDLVNYFSAENLEADGIDPAIFRQGGRLPDGFYTLTVTAFEFDATRGHRQVSNAGFTFMSNFYGYPPTITYPKEGQQLPEQVIQNTLFQWMPRATATQGGIGGLNYDFYLYELQDGEDANDVRNGKAPIFRGNTSQSSFLYGAAYPPMIAGKRYAVQVRVSDIDQQNEYYNDGFSEVVSFTYGTPCVVPTDLAVNKYSAQIAKLRWTPVPNVKQYELAYKLKDASDNTWKTQTSYAYEAYVTLENSVELYEFKVRSLCSNARTSDWSELVSLPSTPAIAKNESPKVRNTTPLNTNPPSPTNTTPIDKVLNPFDIPVSSETITDDQINTRIGEIRDLRSRNKIRCGYSVSDGISCEDNAVNTNQGDDFTNAKGKYVFINGYEILVTRDAGTGNAHTGEGLLYYPLLGTRIPVAWQNASIYKATDDGEDFGCISDKVIAIGSQNGVVAADYRQQVIDLLTSGPHAYSGNLKEALAELKKVVADLNAGKTIDPAYAKNVIDAAQKGIEEWKTTVSKYFTNGTAPLPPEVQQILNSIEAIKNALNAPKDCLAQNIPTTTSPSGRNNIIRLFPIDACTLSAEQKSVLEAAKVEVEKELLKIYKLLNPDEDYACNCSPIVSDCTPIILYLEQIKKANNKKQDKITITKTEGKDKLANDTDWISALNGIEIDGKCFKLSLEFKFNGDSKELFPNNYKETKDGFELLDKENKTLLVIKILGESGQNKYLLQAILKKHLEFRDEETTTTNYFIDTDRTIRLVKGTSQSTIVYYRQIEGTEYERLLQLTINEDGYVNFPASGNHFNRYGGIDEGGRCPYTNEDVGFGDHFLTPDAAAALLGVISEIGDEGWEVHLGDMSSENGSDPWDINNVTTRNIANKTYGHHAGHGHFGTQSGVNIDFRYLATNGVSFQGRWDTDSRFDDDKNRAFFEIANAYGFGRNYATGKDYAGVNPSVPSHYDHGHLGGNHINIITTEKFKFTVK